MEFLFPFVFLIPFGFMGLVLGVWIWGLVDALQVPADVFYRSGSKLLWGILIGVMGPLAAIVYFAAGRPDRTTRDWMAQQRTAGVDLRIYRVYDQGYGRGWPQGGVHGGPPPGYGWYGPSSGGYGPTGHGGYADPSWPGGPWDAQGSPPPGYPPMPPSR